METATKTINDTDLDLESLIRETRIANAKRDVEEAWFVRMRLGGDAWDRAVKYFREEYQGSEFDLNAMMRYLSWIGAKDANEETICIGNTDRYKRRKRINGLVFERWIYEECPDLRSRMSVLTFDDGFFWKASHLNNVNLYPEPYRELVFGSGKGGQEQLALF